MNEKKNTGFAKLTPEQRKEMSSIGGKAAHAKGTGHQWTPEQAKEAGRKGGVAVHAKKRAEISPGVAKAMAGGDSLARFGDNSPPEGN